MSKFVVFALVLLIALSAVLLEAKRVTVIGANGKTGRRVVEVALKKGFEVVAVTRSGELTPPLSAKGLQLASGDVTKLETLTDKSYMANTDAIFFTASASKEGGTPLEVDNRGLVNVARLAIKNSVPRLVVVSSGAVSKPWSPVYLFLNLFGGIMKQKAVGEACVRALYKASGKSSKELGYTIVRPGGLTEEEPLGVQGIAVNQRDEKSGRISRADVAAVCVESLSSPACARVTIECYNADTGKPLSSVGFSNLLKLKDAKEEQAGEYERTSASSWDDLFAKVVSDDAFA